MDNRTQLIRQLSLPARAGFCLSLGLLAGCRHHIGPSTISEDRVAYNDALATTWKEQALLNIVRCRYVDPPVFVDVAQIVSAYAQDKTAGGNVVANIIPNSVNALNPLTLGLNSQHTFADHPTVSYSPQTSAKFVQNLTLPLPPSAVLYLMHSGYPIDVVFDLLLDSINGLRGHVVTGGQVLDASPEFRRIGQVFRKAQLTGQVGMQIEVDKDKKESLVMFIRNPDIDPDLRAELDEVRKLLRIPLDQQKLRVVFGSSATARDEVAMLTRSPYRIMLNLSAFVEAPPAHLADGRVPQYDVSSSHKHFNVHSGCKKPCDAYTAICYKGNWFWIDDTDLESKRTMFFLSIILALADTGSKENVPFLTISTR